MTAVSVLIAPPPLSLMHFIIMVSFSQAKRAGVNCVILPEENRTDFVELDKQLQEDLEIHFVSKYEEVFTVLFPDVYLKRS